MRLLLLAGPAFAVGAAIVGLEACSAKFVGCDNADSCFPADASLEDAGSVDDAGQSDSATAHDVTVDVTDASNSGAE